MNFLNIIQIDPYTIFKKNSESLDNWITKNHKLIQKRQNSLFCSKSDILFPPLDLLNKVSISMRSPSPKKPATNTQSHSPQSPSSTCYFFSIQNQQKQPIDLSFCLWFPKSKFLAVLFSVPIYRHLEFNPMESQLRYYKLL